MTLGDSLRRGLAAGLVAGLLAGLFAYLVGEIPIREAIRIEEAAAADSVGDPATATNDEPLVERPVQQALLPVATAIVGAAFGGLYGLAWAAVRRRMRERSEWRASCKLGASVWAAVALFPGLVYPANPPAVGDPGTIGTRSSWFVVAALVGIAGAVGLWWLSRRLAARGTAEPARHVAVAVATATAFAVLYVALPANTDPIEVPARLLWQFRLASLGTQLILWFGIATGFGWLADRAAQRDADARLVGTP